VLPVADAEVRVTSETGGQKGKKQAQVGALDPQALLEVARVAGFGTEKYERYNFLKGYEWSLSFDALCRHLFAWWSGEDHDPESGLSHMGHVGWHALALLAFSQRNVGTDNRPPIEAIRGRCLDESPQYGQTCVKAQGHDGEHATGPWRWRER